MLWEDELAGWERERGERGYLSASSRMTSFCRPGGKVTFFCAKPLMRLRTTSIPIRRRVSFYRWSYVRHPSLSPYIRSRAIRPLPAQGEKRTSLIRRIQLQHSLLVRIPQHLPRQTQYTRRLAYPGHARDNDMRHVAIFRNDLQALNSFCVADDIVEVDGTVFFDPSEARRQTYMDVEWTKRSYDNGRGFGRRLRGLYQGSS